MTWYDINTEKSGTFLHTNDKHTKKEIIPLTINKKKFRNLGLKLTKKVGKKKPLNVKYKTQKKTLAD